MENVLEWECGGRIHELLAGADDKTKPSSPGRSAESLGLQYSSIPVWDPVKRESYFPSVAHPYSSAEEERMEAELAARLGAKYPPEAGFGKPVARAVAFEGMAGGKPRKSKPKTKTGGKGGSGALELSDGEAFELARFQREMELRKVNVGEFRGAIRAGGFKAVHLVAQGPFFMIQAEPQGKSAKTGLAVDDSAWLTLVTTKNRKNHMFLNPGTALAMLKDLGVKSVQVDLESWRPNHGTDNERRRPDMADRLRFAHEYAREGGEAKLEGS